MAFSSRNTLFVRNLSPQVSEAVLRETFGKCDVVEQVLFRSFPGRSAEYFAQIDFRTSAGVTEGFKLSGTPILGVVCQVSVMDPGSKAMMKQLWETREQQLLPPDEEAPHPSEPQGVQAEYMRRWKEAEEDKRLRTVHIAGLTEDATEEGLRLLCGQLGEVLDLRMDKDGEGKCFGLVEFKDRNIAYAVKARAEFLVDGRTLVFSESKTLVDTRAFAEQSVHFSTPIFDASTMKAVLAYQCHLNPKLAKARAAAAEIMNEPVPPETEAMLKQAEEAKKEPEPVQWPGRSEKDSTQWPWRPADSARQRRSSRSRERRRRGRGSRSRERSGGRGRPRREGRSRSRSRRRRRREEAGEDGRRRRRRREGEDAIDLDDEDVAMVPNTEMLVLGETSSYSDCSQSPAREGKDAAAAAPEPPEPEPAPECHEIPSLPSPVRSIADSLPGEDVDVVAADCDVPAGEEAPASDADRDLAGSAGSGAAPLLDPAAGAAPPAEGAAAAEGCGAAEPRPAGDANGVDSLAEAGSRGLETGTATSSRERPGVAPARWECSRCGEVNKPSRTQCNNCGANAPWVKEEEPVEDVDELSTPSERSPSPARSLGESPPSPARSVQESPPSPPRSIAASGSARSVAESEHSPARSIAESEGGLVDIAESNSEKGDEECEWAAERVRGEVADARARIFHETGS